MKIAEGIHLIEVPTPFAVGAVNCYLIEGDPLTIIDTGVKSTLALGKLTDGIKDAGHELSDIRQICLTHGHVDHIGLTQTIIRESQHDVDVWIHKMDAERIIDYEGYIEDRMHAYHRIATESGAPVAEGLLQNQETLAAYFLRFGESVPKINLLKDGQEIPTGLGDLHAVWTPGHSRGSVCLVLQDKQVLFSGDHILGSISSNPSLDFDGVMGISILNYFKSLEKVRKYNGFKVLPGHRGLIMNLNDRIDELLDDYQNKIESVSTFLSETPITIYDLSRKLYGDYNSSELILALAESADLVRVLQERGQAKLIQTNGVLCATQ